MIGRRERSRVGWFLCGFLALAAILAGFGYRKLEAEQRKARRAGAVAVTERRAPIARTMVAVATPEVAPPTEVPAPVEDVPVDPDESRVIVRQGDAEEIARLERRATFYQQAFERESRDPVWSSTTVESVRLAYPATEGVDAVLVSAECHSTLCRVEFTYRDPALRADHLGMLASQFEELPRAVYAYPDEATRHDRAVAYFARRGFELPEYQEPGAAN